MRVQLVKPQPSATPDTPPPNVVVTPPPLPISPSETFLRIATRWPFVLPIAFVAIGIASWSLFVRLPGTTNLLTVHARALQFVEPTIAPISANEAARLHDDVQRASATLIPKRERLGPLLFDLETSARRLGWRVNVSMKPAVSAPGGLKDLTLHPVTFQLADEADRTESAYPRLLEWLRIVSSLPTRAEVAALRLRSVGAGLGGAEVELQLFSLNSNEETASK